MPIEVSQMVELFRCGAALGLLALGLLVGIRAWTGGHFYFQQKSFEDRRVPLGSSARDVEARLISRR